MGDKIGKAFDKDTSFRTLELVNSWIIAADNKSSILLAFIGLIVGLSANTYGKIAGIIINGTGGEITLIIIIGLLYFSILGLTIFQLISVFIARTTIKDIFSENLVSFISIADMNNLAYIDYTKSVDENKLCEMILSQIATNSRITKIKMKHFNHALKSCVLLIPLTIILMIFTGLI